MIRLPIVAAFVFAVSGAALAGDEWVITEGVDPFTRAKVHSAAYESSHPIGGRISVTCTERTVFASVTFPQLGSRIRRSASGVEISWVVLGGDHTKSVASSLEWPTVVVSEMDKRSTYGRKRSLAFIRDIAHADGRDVTVRISDGERSVDTVFRTVGTTEAIARMSEACQYDILGD